MTLLEKQVSIEQIAKIIDSTPKTVEKLSVRKSSLITAGTLNL